MPLRQLSLRHVEMNVLKWNIHLFHRRPAGERMKLKNAPHSVAIDLLTSADLSLALSFYRLLSICVMCLLLLLLLLPLHLHMLMKVLHCFHCTSVNVCWVGREKISSHTYHMMLVLIWISATMESDTCWCFLMMIYPLMLLALPAIICETLFS